MLTLAIVSSAELDPSLKKRIHKNSGVENCQIIEIKSGTNFAKAYQEGLDQAQFDQIIFISDHIHIVTKDWALKLHNQLLNSEYGALGVLGSIRIDDEGQWFGQVESMLGRVYFLDEKKRHEVCYSESFEGDIVEALTLDASLFIVDKNRIKSGFDNKVSSREYFDTDFFFTNFKKGVSFGCSFLIKAVYTHLEPVSTPSESQISYFKSKHQDIAYELTPSIIIQKRRPTLKREPKLAIMIPTHNASLEALNCLKSIQQHSNYSQIQIYIVDMASSNQELDLLELHAIEHDNVRLLQFNHKHSPSIYKQVVQEHLDDERLLLFVSPYTVLINDAISFAVETYCNNREVCGTVGVRLHRADNRIHQLGLDLFSEESHEGFDLNIGLNAKGSAYKYKNVLMENVLGSSKDFMLISRSLYDEVGGLNTQYLYSLSDFELNMNCILQGKRNFINAKGVSYLLDNEEPKCLEEDYMRLLSFVNSNIETLTPFVKFYNKG
jgi:hypothetical protein